MTAEQMREEIARLRAVNAELLTVLRNVLADGPHGVTLERARAAIAKAEGQA